MHAHFLFKELFTDYFLWSICLYSNYSYLNGMGLQDQYPPGPFSPRNLSVSSLCDDILDLPLWIISHNAQRYKKPLRLVKPVTKPSCNQGQSDALSITPQGLNHLGICMQSKFPGVVATPPGSADLLAI